MRFLGKKKSISISIMYSNLPQTWESHRKFLSVICYLDFCSTNSIYFGLICILWKCIILTFVFQHSNHGLLPCGLHEQAHTAPEQSCWAVKTLLSVYTVTQGQFTHKQGLAHKQLSLTLVRPHQNGRKNKQTVETILQILSWFSVLTKSCCWVRRRPCPSPKKEISPTTYSKDSYVCSPSPTSSSAIVMRWERFAASQTGVLNLSGGLLQAAHLGANQWRMKHHDCLARRWKQQVFSPCVSWGL